jgi:SWI/SNF-related matrix-associated actin-dependent regulator 1 of chromatin subfamily A
MIRRLKKDVLQDLPDKQYSFTPIEIDNEKEYENAERDFIAFVRATKGDKAATRASNAQALAEIEGLKQLAVKGKLKVVKTWIQDFLDDDGKLVVFAHHKFVIDSLMETFKEVAVKLDGSVSQTDRQKAIDDFQNVPSIRLFIGNIKAAGVGCTLTAASNVAFVELPWTPGDLSQAEDRCHRIGQKDSVNIHYLLSVGTIEEKIAHMLDTKRKVLASVHDGEEAVIESMLSELMNDYNN